MIRLSHIGIVVRDIGAFSAILRQVCQAEAVSEVVHDPAQQALLQMFRSGDGYLEVIAPDGENSHVHTALKKMGEGLLHLCFETDDLDGTLQRVREEGVLVFRPPTPAVLFGGKRVAFAMLPNRMVVEFVEEGWDEAAPNG
jgi:methylmalonyl-CoA/ethylmalonyl-CoA epimerase